MGYIVFNHACACLPRTGNEAVAISLFVCGIVFSCSGRDMVWMANARSCPVRVPDTKRGARRRQMHHIFCAPCTQFRGEPRGPYVGCTTQQHTHTHTTHGIVYGFSCVRARLFTRTKNANARSQRAHLPGRALTAIHENRTVFKARDALLYGLLCGMHTHSTHITYAHFSFGNDFGRVSALRGSMAHIREQCATMQAQPTHNIYEHTHKR